MPCHIVVSLTPCAMPHAVVQWRTCCCCSNFMNIIDYLRIYLFACIFIYLFIHVCYPFNGPLSGTTWVSRFQKGKTIWILLKQEWQWHQLGHMQVCTSLQTDNHANTPPLFFTGRMPFLPPNQQRQSTEGTALKAHIC